jgi:hypothetical protein
MNYITLIPITIIVIKNSMNKIKIMKTKKNKYKKTHKIKI